MLSGLHGLLLLLKLGWALDPRWSSHIPGTWGLQRKDRRASTFDGLLGNSPWGWGRLSGDSPSDDRISENILRVTATQRIDYGSSSSGELSGDGTRGAGRSRLHPGFPSDSLPSAPRPPSPVHFVPIIQAAFPEQQDLLHFGHIAPAGGLVDLAEVPVPKEVPGLRSRPRPAVPARTAGARRRLALLAPEAKNSLHRRGAVRHLICRSVFHRPPNSEPELDGTPPGLATTSPQRSSAN